MCFDCCTKLGSASMATQYSFECWCFPDGGLDYNRPTTKTIGADAVCDMPYMGDEVLQFPCGIMLRIRTPTSSK